MTATNPKLRLNKITKLILSVLCVSSSAAANAQQVTMAQTGFSGLLRTPTAQTLNFGEVTFSASWEDNVDENSFATKGAHNSLAAGIGLIPGLEFIVQDTYKKFQWDGWGKHLGSDLSFSTKYQLSRWFPQMGVNIPNLDVAIGFQDFGGANSFHKNLYTVASYQYKEFQFSAGYGKGYNQNQMGENFLGRPFGGVSWQATTWAQLIAEYDGTGANTGIKLFTPEQWLPRGWQVNLAAQLYSGSETFNRDNAWYGLQLNIPLSSGTNTDRYTNNGVVHNPVTTTTVVPHPIQKTKNAPVVITKKRTTNSENSNLWKLKSTNVTTEKTTGVTDAQLDRIANRLSAEGFESISVGKKGERVVVALENTIYSWNDIDALGVALGMISETLTTASTGKGKFELYLLKKNIPVIKVTGNALHYMNFLNSDNKHVLIPHGSGLYVTNYNLNSALESVNWLTHEQRKASYTPRLGLAPSLYSSLGTDYGVFDYSLALAVNLQLPLWQGAEIDVRGMAPIEHTNDYGKGREFPFQKHQSGVDRILIHQAFSLPHNVMTQFSLGRIFRDYEGVMNETRWQSPSGRHKVSFEVSRFEHKDFDNLVGEPAIATYRYHMPERDWSVELSGGQYWQGDKGYSIISKHWFGDTAINITYQDTDQTFAGLTFEIPFTPRKEMRARGVQVTGINQWRWGYRTQLNDTHNMINSGLGGTSTLQHSIDRVYYNRDRLSPAYIRSNQDRLKTAYQRYVTKN